MVSYKNMKKALGKDTKYFTEEFYQKWLEEKRASFEWFCTYGKWKGLKESECSDFYLKNGCGWCKMLEIFYDSQPRFRIDFFKDHYRYWGDMTERRYEHFECLEDAKKWAAAYQPTLCTEINLCN